MAMADWSELADDLIGEIAKNIGCVEDFLLFSRVCPSWRSAAVKENWISGRQLPWLALAEKEDESTKNSSHLRGFFNLNKKKRYDLNIPQRGITRSWGSSLGCIVTVNLDHEFHIINPLSGLKLNLPHLYTLKHMPKNDDDIEIPYPNSFTPADPDYIEPVWVMAKHIIKAILCKNNENLFVAVIYGEFEFMAIACPGDQSWTEVELEEKPLFQDVVVFNDQHYAVTYGGGLVVLEFDWLHPPKCITIVPPYTVYSIDTTFKKVYLVESSGDLLMVVRYKGYPYPDDDDKYGSTSFHVYKFNTDDQKWIELKNLGDMALFIGDSYSMSLCSSDVTGCESNVIYYTDDHKPCWDFLENYGGHDMGSFSLKENVKRPLIVDNPLEGDNLRSSFSCPVWMIPNLF